MASGPNATSGYVADLPRAYGLFTAGLAGFVVVLAVLEFVGTPDVVITWLLVSVPLGGYVLVGIASRTLQVQEFFAAGRRVPPVLGGMAGAANWIGGTVLLAATGAFFVGGAHAFAYGAGLTGGFVLLAVLVAPYLRKFGAFTVSDFLAVRFASTPVRLAAIVVLVAASVPLMAVEFRAVALVLSRALGVDEAVALQVGALVVVCCTLFGGIRALTWSQAAQFIVLAMAIIVPTAIVSAMLAGGPVAPFALDGALERIAEIEATLGGGQGAVASLAEAGGRAALLAPYLRPVPLPELSSAVALALCLMLGTAAFPHVLMHASAASRVSDARRAAAWSLGFVVLVLVFLPAVAVFARLSLLTQVAGRSPADLPGWFASWSGAGLLSAGDSNGDGRIGLSEIQVDPEAILLGFPEMAGAPHVLGALLLAGLLAAALSTAGGLLLATASALGHDVYYRLLDRTASTAKRLVAARLSLLVTAAGAVWLAGDRNLDLSVMAMWAFSLAAAGNFPALVLCIWWRRANGAGAAAGMIAGLLTVAGHIYWSHYLGRPAPFGVEPAAAGILGVPVGFAVAVLVSKATRAPSAIQQALVDDIRLPRGASAMERERAAERIREVETGR